MKLVVLSSNMEESSLFNSIQAGDHVTIVNRQKLDWQIANGAEVVGSYKHYSWEDCLKRYPRIIKALSGGYYTTDEAACLLRDIRWFREVEPARHAKLCENFRIHMRIRRNLSKLLREEVSV